MLEPLNLVLNADVELRLNLQLATFIATLGHRIDYLPQKPSSLEPLLGDARRYLSGVVSPLEARLRCTFGCDV